MQITITFRADGGVDVVVPNQSGLTFEAAVARLKTLEKELGIAGLPLTFVGAPEAHSHAPGATTAHSHQHSH